MKQKLSRLAVASGIAVTLLACSDSVTSPKGPVPLGAWGNAESGLGASLLTVTGTGATLQQTCAHGTIAQPIVLDANGHFDVAGEYELTAGPTELPRPARYTGSVSGQTMTLTVTQTDPNTTVGPFVLRLGERPSFGACPIV